MHCARSHVGDERAQRIRDLAHGRIDWHKLAAAVQRHSIGPLAYQTLSDLGLSEALAHDLAPLRTFSEAHRARNRRRIPRLLAVLRALDAAGIAVMPYKGPVLSAWLYGDSTLRQHADFDLVVKPADAIAARRVLIGEGCAPARRVPERVLPLYVRQHSAFNFEPKNDIAFDLQWATAARFWRYPDIFEGAWDRSVWFDFEETRVRWFAPGDILILLCLHGIKHKWNTLKLVADIAELVRANPDLDWDGVLDDATRVGAERMLGLALLLSHDVLEAPVPPGVIELLRAMPQVAAVASEIREEELFAEVSPPMDAVETVRLIGRMCSRLDTTVMCYALRVPYYLRDSVRHIRR